MRCVTPLATSLDNRLMGLNICPRLANILMAGQAESTIAVRLFEKATGLRIVQPVTADTVAVGKGPMQAEPPPFIRLPFMTAETEGRLRGNE